MSRRASLFWPLMSSKAQAWHELVKSLTVKATRTNQALRHDQAQFRHQALSFVEISTYGLVKRP